MKIKPHPPADNSVSTCLFMDIEKLSSQQREIDKAVDTLGANSYQKARSIVSRMS